MGQEDKGRKLYQEETDTTTDVRIWQQQIVRGVLRALVVVGFIAAAASSYYSYTQGLVWVIPLYALAYVVVLVVAFWQRVPYKLQVWVIIGAFYALAVLDFATEGRGASARLFLLLMPFVAALFLGQRETFLSSALALLTILGFAFAFSTGMITDYQEVDSTDPAGWASNTFVWFMLATLVVVSLRYLVPRLSDTLEQSRRLAGQLEVQRDQLEDAVSQRTADLERRRGQLETAAQVARDAAGIQDVEELLQQTVQLISTRFGYYHAGIFLLDKEGTFAQLRAASSAGGQRMLARGYQMEVGGVGLVGHAARLAEPQIALDVGQNAVFFDNPDLPDTRSEIALPLETRGEIIGVLDVQSRESQAFGSEDVAVLQTLADQVAVAISNARLFQQAQESLEAERQAYGELSAKAWRELTRTRPDLAQRYDPEGILPSDGDWRAEMKAAVQSAKPMPGVDGNSRTLAIPLRVRGQVIGVLNAYKQAGSGDWEPEETNMLQSLVEQLGLAMDSARLYQDTQRRAVQDRMLTEVTARMRERLDIEMVLQTAVQEMRGLMDLAEVEVRMGTGPAPGENGRNNG